MQQPGEDLSNFFYWDCGGCKKRCVIDTCLHGSHNPVDILVHWEREVQDNTTLSPHLGHNHDRRDLEVRRSQALEVLPQHDLTKTGLDLVCNILLEEVNQIWGRGCWMGPTSNCCLNNLSGPVGAAVHLYPMLPLVQCWHEWVCP